ncbi:MAG: ATP-binding protein, partial [Chloroflexi bacterium]|nr:ATP-binding protein [Chloroflexota bacterium]
QLPAEAQAERTHLEAQSVQSVLVVPLVSRNTLVGFFGFDAVTKQRVWSPDNILLIKMAGDILSNALTHIKMQNDLLQSEARNTALLSAVPDMILRIHRDGTVTDYKPSSANELPASLQIVGSSISHIVPDHLMKEAMNHINQVLQTKENKTMEFSLDLGDSSHVFEARFKDSGADEVTAIIRDVSDRARLEQMKSDFINRATHELRTPIATMILMIDLLDGDATDEERLEYWKILKSELGRERTLVEDLLSAGRLESDQAQWHFQFIDSEKIVRQAMSQFEVPAREKEIKLSLQTMGALDGNSFVVFADENALTQVFVNLVGNAIKFTPVGGRVSILLKRINGGIEISVVDTGIGILSEDIPMLFNRFFRGTNAIQEEIQGTGIGLFIVRSIMEKHRGTIKVHSKVGKGSQFVIWMPVDHQ